MKHPRTVSIDELPVETIGDIIYEIDEKTGMSSDDIRDSLLGMEPATRVVLWHPSPKKMKSQFQRGRRTSPVAVKQYAKMLKDGVDFDPILTRNGKFLDGGHRVMAYIKSGRSSIPAVDIGHLLSMDWESWLDGSTPAKTVNDEAWKIAESLA